MSTLSSISDLLRRGFAQKALTSAKAEARRHPKDADRLDLLAQCYVAVGDKRRALATYDRLIAVAPRAAKPYADKALLLQQSGDMEAAAKHLRKALRLPASENCGASGVGSKHPSGVP